MPNNIRPGWMLLGVAMPLFFANGFSQSVYGPLTHSFASAYGPHAVAGNLTSLQFIGALISMLANAAVPMHLQRTWALIAMALFTLGSGLFFIPTWSAALTGALLIGLGYGAITMVFLNRFATGFGNRSAARTSLLNVAWGLGSISGPIVVSQTLGRLAAPFWITTVVSAAVMWPLYFVLRPQPQSTANPVASSAAAKPTATSLLPFVGLFVVYTMGEMGFALFTSSHALRQGLSAPAAAAAPSYFWFGMLAGRLLLAFWPHPLPPGSVVRYGSLLGSAFLLALIGFPSQIWIIALIGACWGPMFPNSVVWSSDTFGGSPLAASIVVSASSVGAVLASPLLATPIQNFGLPLVLLTLAILHVVLAWTVCEKAGRRIIRPVHPRGDSQ